MAGGNKAIHNSPVLYCVLVGLLAKQKVEESDGEGYLTPTLLDIGMASYIDGAPLARCSQPKVATLAWADKYLLVVIKHGLN